jgi:hypothetical protein
MLPVTPDETALIGAEPAPTAVTKPLPLTVAMEVLALTQVNVVPESVLPWASLATADNCVDCPTESVLLLGVTVMLATLEVPVTRNVSWAYAVPLVTLIFVVPEPIPVTTPDGDTVRTDGLSDA